MYKCTKLQSVYGVHKVQMPSPGRCVNGGALLRNYDATNVAHAQKDKPSTRRRGTLISKHIRVNSFRTNKNYVMGSERARNQE
jgi:hypothetical protein